MPTIYSLTPFDIYKHGGMGRTEYFYFQNIDYCTVEKVIFSKQTKKWVSHILEAIAKNMHATLHFSFKGHQSLQINSITYMELFEEKSLLNVETFINISKGGKQNVLKS